MFVNAGEVTCRICFHLCDLHSNSPRGSPVILVLSKRRSLTQQSIKKGQQIVRKSIHYVFVTNNKFVEVAYKSIREVLKFGDEYLLEHFVVCNNQ